MPLDPNAPEGMLQWIPEPGLDGDEGFRQDYNARQKRQIYDRKQLALSPDQRDPMWIKVNVNTFPILQGKPFINEEATLADFGLRDWNDFSNNPCGTKKKSWFAKLFGG